MGATQDKITINENGVSMILDARKVQKKKHDVLIEGNYVCPRSTRGTNQYSRTENGHK